MKDWFWQMSHCFILKPVILLRFISFHSEPLSSIMGQALLSVSIAVQNIKLYREGRGILLCLTKGTV